MDAAHGRWPQDGFCQVAYLRDSSTSSYQLSVDMYNFIGSGKVNLGHPGVFLNAEDQDNYDFVYFRFVCLFVVTVLISNLSDPAKPFYDQFRLRK